MKLFLTALLALCAGASTVRAADKLLPTEQVGNMSVSFRQDGRAVYVSLSNNSAFVVTSADVVCSRIVTWMEKGCRPNKWYDCSIPSMRSESFRPEFNALRLLPGKSAEAYIEAEVNIERCGIVEVRGREKPFYELF